MSASPAPTTTVEIDADLLDELRARTPEKSDRALIEDLARIEVGFQALAESQRENCLDADQAGELAVRAVHEGRHGG